MILDQETQRRADIDPLTGTMDPADFVFIRDNYGNDPTIDWLLDEVMKLGRALDITRYLLYQYAIVAKKDPMSPMPERRSRKNGYVCRICACVNACEGLSNDALEDGVIEELIEKAKAIVEGRHGRMAETCCGGEPYETEVDLGDDKSTTETVHHKSCSNIMRLKRILDRLDGGDDSE